MHTTITPLTDEQFLAQFEDQTLNKIHFDHIGHLRLAWLYLKQYDVDTAMVGVSQGIQMYAECLGAPHKFHATITAALVQIMAGRMDTGCDQPWSLFLLENPDLVADALSVLSRHFSKETLFSEKARVSVVPPDIRPF